MLTQSYKTILLKVAHSTTMYDTIYKSCYSNKNKKKRVAA